jgi:hypothetical protein
LQISSLVSAGVAFGLLVLISLKLFDAQVALNMAEGFVSAAIVSFIVAWLAVPDYPAAFRILMLGVVVVILIFWNLWSLSSQGMTKFYWDQKSYGDVSLSLVALVAVSTIPAYSVWVFGTV